MRRWTVVLVVLALLVGACGDDDDDGAVAEEPSPADSPEPTDTATPSPEPTDTPTPSPEPTDTPTPSPEPTDTPTPTATAAPAELTLPGPEGWCPAAQEAQTALDQIGLVDPSDPVALEAAYLEGLAAVQEAQPFAPLVLTGAVAISIDGLEVISDSLNEVDWNVLEFDPSVLIAIEEDQARAGFAINRYNFEVCGIDNGFDPADDPSTVFGPADDEDLRTVREVAIDEFVMAGFTAEEAACIADRLDVNDLPDLSDTEAILAFLEECGIGLERLTEIYG